ncbi:PIN-like domain-containing protein [Bradyrhizobium sp.]|uniref:PIN-like domain-containing protein n=1 Tax=Bradyrhizobium sp. TaxID=376 RepID=UPI0007C98F62|nr:PIN-like domain-containing protein [Bradyrhizobium sp.]
MNHAERQKRLIDVLDRQVPCDSLSALVSAMRPDTATVELQNTAIGLDASVFLRVANHTKSADIIDYLGSRHSAPLILPGQAVQEFWNNQLQVVDTVAASLRRQFDAFKGTLSRVDRHFGTYVGQIDALLDQFSAEHGHVYDEATVRKTLSLFEVLAEKASVTYAPRAMFHEIGTLRKKTKTPPGFRDEGDGDFFIWVDLLTGLLEAQLDGEMYERVVLVSLDKKVDWSRAGMAHPILVAEVRALLNVPFEIWTIDRLADAIAAVP